MEPITFGIIGGGWRTSAYLQIARELPSRFRVTGMVVRDAQKGAALTGQWGVPTFRTPEVLMATRPDFIVLSVPWAVTPSLILDLAAKGMPVLAETPPAPDLAGIESLLASVPKTAIVQVAEQYPFQPYLASCIHVARSGRLGPISQAQVSVAHGYHGIAVMRKLLGVGALPVEIRARRFESLLVEGPGRGGPPTQEKVKASAQAMAWLSFGDKLGVFDFCGDQYFSWVRSQRLLVRGERGEINGDTVRSLEDYRTPVREVFVRENAGEKGNLEGHHLKAITLGRERVFENAFPARLSDDEIAIATCLEKMGAHVRGGASFYSLAEGAYDHYLGLTIDKAAKEGGTVQVPVPGWMLATALR